MRKQSPKQKSSAFSNLLWYYILALSFMGFGSCKHEPKQRSQIEPTKKNQAINGIKKDSFSPPKVIPITTANQPKSVRAGKPIIRIDSLYGDAPFFTNYSTDQGLALSTISCSIVDNVGNLWFGTNGGGVSRYDGKAFTNYTTAQGLAGNTVWGIIQDKAGYIWFGTNAGVSRYDGKTFTNFTTSQGLADNVVYSIAEDTVRHIIWFGTNFGLSGLRLSLSPNSNGQTNMFEIFNKNTGYPIKDLNTDAGFIDNKGILWAGCGDNKNLSCSIIQQEDGIRRNYSIWKWLCPMSACSLK